MPIPAIKTVTEVPPLEMKGSGNPVGGIEPFNNNYCNKYILITEKYSRDYLEKAQ